MHYMGASQFKSFLKCEQGALAELNEEYGREVSTALLVGSYVDAHFEGSLDIFIAQHMDEVLTKSGKLKADYINADNIINRVERDKFFMEYMSGEKQVIMTGEIAGVPFKIRIDSYHHDKMIVDLKCMKDFDDIWNEDKGSKEHFIFAWGYDLQGAIYQEIVRQNTGKKLPFFIAGCTKEKPEPNLEIFKISQRFLDAKLNEVISLAPRYQRIKEGLLKPMRCDNCNYCRFTKVLTESKDLLEEVDYFE